MSEVRERHEQAARQVATGLQQLTDPTSWRRWLELAVRFPHQTLTNQLLIQAQHPQATLVQSAKHWRQVGRWPAKGSTALRIWTPRTPHPNEPRRATLSPVFDLTQTQGADLVQQPAPTPPPPGRAPRGMWEALAEYATQHGVDVAPRPLGQADDLTQTLNLVGRIGDQLAHDRPEPRCEQAFDRLHSESVKYLVAADYGLVTAVDWQFQALPADESGHSPTAQQIKAQAQAVLKTAKPLLTHLREAGVGHPDPHTELLAMAPHAPHIARAR